LDVLEDPAIRAGIKGFSNWPAVLQLYVSGEFVGAHVALWPGAPPGSGSCLHIVKLLLVRFPD
jgi:hypothetical protein